ncbi:MAG TPA: hypothetical protein VHR42_10290, partial [Clostridia bacterium]|nr:hypothetical protein [Clostridia bacterium]
IFFKLCLIILSYCGWFVNLIFAVVRIKSTIFRGHNRQRAFTGAFHNSMPAPDQMDRAAGYDYGFESSR